MNKKRRSFIKFILLTPLAILLQRFIPKKDKTNVFTTFDTKTILLNEDFQCRIESEKQEVLTLEQLRKATRVLKENRVNPPIYVFYYNENGTPVYHEA
jgi:hypothetical protein